jgi:hypothetical protein
MKQSKNDNPRVEEGARTYVSEEEMSKTLKDMKKTTPGRGSWQVQRPGTWRKL